MSDLKIPKVEIGPDATNQNCRRIHVDGAQWCKVYGFDQAQVEERANHIADSLRANPNLLSLDDRELNAIREWRWGNLTKLGLVNYLRRAGYRSEVAIERATRIAEQFPQRQQFPIENPFADALELEFTDEANRIEATVDQYKPGEPKGFIKGQAKAFRDAASMVRVAAYERPRVEGVRG